MITKHPVVLPDLKAATYEDRRAFVAPFEEIAITLLNDSEDSIRKVAITLCGAVGTDLCLSALVDHLTEFHGGDLLVLGNVLSQHKLAAGRILLERLRTGKPNEAQETYLMMLKYTACPELLHIMFDLYRTWYDLRDQPHLNGRFAPGEFHREVLISAIQTVDYGENSNYLEAILTILAHAARDESTVVRASAVNGLVAYIRALLQPR